MARETTPIYTISIAAELSGMHAQTLRQYDRLGIVVPARTRGGGRRYSPRDVQQLREVQRLSTDEGVNLAGIQMIFELRRSLEKLRDENERLRAVAEPGSRVFHAGPAGDVVVLPRGRRRGDGAVEIRGPVCQPRREMSEGAPLVLWHPSRIGF